ncbi:hypothetical protein BH11PLA2_BH11PLA2_23240 [soil metagenome]
MLYCNLLNDKRTSWTGAPKRQYIFRSAGKCK